MQGFSDRVSKGSKDNKPEIYLVNKDNKANKVNKGNRDNKDSKQEIYLDSKDNKGNNKEIYLGNKVKIDLLELVYLTKVKDNKVIFSVNNNKEAYLIKDNKDFLIKISKEMEYSIKEECRIKTVNNCFKM